MGRRRTDEQQNMVDLALTGENLKGNAFAGSGKTTTSIDICIALFPKRGLYLCFGKANADEAEEKIRGAGRSNVEVRTGHSLAYRQIVLGNRGFQEKLKGRLNGYLVAQKLGIRDFKAIAPFTFVQYGNFVLQTVNRFCQDHSFEFRKSHVPMKQIREYEEKKKLEVDPFVLRMMFKDAQRLWEMMSDPDDSTYMTHDTYLKLYSMTQPTLSEYDFVILDEAQDSNGVLLSFVYGCHAQQIYIGDEFQQIFSWRGAVNAMRSLDVKNVVNLTQSFRFGDKVAALATAILKNELGCDIPLKGFDAIKDRVVGAGCELLDGKIDCMIFRTNAGLVAEALGQIKKQRKVAIVGDVNALVSLVEGIEELDKTNKSKHPDLRDFNNYSDFIEYTESELGKDLGVIVKIIDDIGYPTLIDNLKKIKDNREEDSDIILTTAHKSKGREWPNVKLGSDFNMIEKVASNRMEPGEKKPLEINREEFNLLYVTVTRAQNILDVSELAFFSLPEYRDLVESKTNQAPPAKPSTTGLMKAG